MPTSINIITGVAGQDGSYLVDLLTSKNSIVFGLQRATRSSPDTFKNLEVEYAFFDGSITSLLDAYREGIRCFILDCDILSRESIAYSMTVIDRFIREASLPGIFGLSETKPVSLYPLRFYCYHMAALSHVGESYDKAELYMRTNTFGSLNVLKEFMNMYKAFDIYPSPQNQAYFYHAATTELFSGNPKTVPQTVDTPFEPQTPYAVSKLAAVSLLKFEVEKNRGIHNINLRQGILGNHESPRRPAKFVTQKIIKGIYDYIDSGFSTKVQLGNLSAKRDWGYAKEYMEIIIKMMTLSKPDLFVVGTGRQYSVEDFINFSLEVFNKKLGLDLKLDDVFTYNVKSFLRSKEVHSLCVDPRETFELLEYEIKYHLEDLIEVMSEKYINDLLQRKERQ